MSNLVVNKVRFIISTLYRLSVTQELMLAVLRWRKLIQLARCKFHAFHRPRSHRHGCNYILVHSGPFQKAGRERDCIHTGVWKKSSELVQNRSKIRVVHKSKPEIGPVCKRTIPFPCEQKRQVQFRSTFRTCWVSTGTCKCISLTKLVTFSQYIRGTLFSFSAFFIFRNKLLNSNFSEPQNSFFGNFITDVFFIVSLTINILPLVMVNECC